MLSLDRGNSESWTSLYLQERGSETRQSATSEKPHFFHGGTLYEDGQEFGGQRMAGGPFLPFCNVAVGAGLPYFVFENKLPRFDFGQTARI